MATRTIQKFVAALQSRCAWAQALILSNADGSRFDYSSGVIVGQIRQQANSTTSVLATLTVTRSNPAQGELVVSLSAHDVGAIPVAGMAFTSAQKVAGELDLVPDADPRNPIRLAEIDVRVSPGGNLDPDEADAPTIPLETVNLVVGAASPATTRALLGLSPAQVAYQTLMMG